MNLSTRQQQILAMLAQTDGRLDSSELTKAFQVSVQTIRKDLNELSNRGLVQRVHGGITRPRQNRNLSFSNRQVINLEAKRAIAQAVAKRLPEGASIFLGIGTTCQQVAQALLDHPGLQVITNNLNAAITLCHNPRIETLVAGGRIRPADQDLMGEDTTRFLRRFQVNYGIFGIGGLSARGELMDFSPEESHLSRAIIDCADQSILVADSSKYLRSVPVRTGVLEEIDLFVTDRLPPEVHSLLTHTETELVCTNMPTGEYTDESA
ncbi:DeoR/GlpR family DNA-binding transcription regulator [Marinobacter lutaoensis]|jgi:DeoR family glycerol-3-phosphate regulon repressor|uniref:DeoR/GlpR family DNA-binding transcription regulator n=1 Tax=Marinobacter lutaoensis TaxID=135739 RepID=UPI001592D94D|nr:DeoR/GlpR family DNA-binding transcription regulator [Marinobacter lutaoensis]NVD37024.1 DeoR/GlpR transcriptional regulator [Marinobacter lutaoensis]